MLEKTFRTAGGTGWAPLAGGAAPRPVGAWPHGRPSQHALRFTLQGRQRGYAAHLPAQGQPPAAAAATPASCAADERVEAFRKAGKQAETLKRQPHLLAERHRLQPLPQ